MNAEAQTLLEVDRESICGLHLETAYPEPALLEPIQDASGEHGANPVTPYAYPYPLSTDNQCNSIASSRPISYLGCRMKRALGRAIP